MTRKLLTEFFLSPSRKVVVSRTVPVPIDSEELLFSPEHDDDDDVVVVVVVVVPSPKTVTFAVQPCGGHDGDASSSLHNNNPTLVSKLS